MKYFIDTEFHEYKKDGVDTIELISIGIVGEDGREYYAESLDFDLDAAMANEWLNENVIAHLWSRQPDKTPFIRWIADGGSGGVRHAPDIASEIRRFVGEKPEFYGYYADYDWVVFCWLYGRMIDLPGGWPMYCRDLKQMYDAMEEEDYLLIPGNDRRLKDHPDYPKQENEHNALDDARWNRDLYAFLVDMDLMSKA